MLPATLVRPRDFDHNGQLNMLRERGDRAMSPPRFLIVLGGPAAGKGTQAELLSRALGVPHISTGELLREQANAEAQAIMRRGDLLPDETVTAMLIARLQQPDASKGAVLDGFPRTLAQAQTLDGWIAQNTGGSVAAIYLEVPEAEMVRRLIARGETSGRADDRAQAAPRRLERFLEELPPVLEHYAARGALRRVDGTLQIDEIHAQIRYALKG
jgi:adenylate kinase